MYFLYFCIFITSRYPETLKKNRGGINLPKRKNRCLLLAALLVYVAAMLIGCQPAAQNPTPGNVSGGGQIR